MIAIQLIATRLEHLMAVHLTIRVTDDGMLVASHQGDVLAEGTPFAALRRIERKADNRESNPYRTAPFELGQTLYAAMGGEALWTRLNEDTDGLLLLDCDLQSGTIPWEYAVTPARHWLVARFGFLRYLPDAPAARPAPDGPLNLVVLAADPLVAERDKKLYALDPFLDIETELKAIEATVAASGQALTAQRIPPTKQSLQSALRHRAPALLHLSCHGNVIPVERNGQTVYEALLTVGGCRRQSGDADGRPVAAAGPRGRAAVGGDERLPHRRQCAGCRPCPRVGQWRRSGRGGDAGQLRRPAQRRPCGGAVRVAAGRLAAERGVAPSAAGARRPPRCHRPGGRLCQRRGGHAVAAESGAAACDVATDIAAVVAQQCASAAALRGA